MKKCKQCEVEKEIESFYVHNGMKDGHLNKCKECVKSRVRRDRQVSPNARLYDKKRYKENPVRRAKVLADSKRRQLENPEKAKAHRAVSNAIRNNKLIKPKTCSECGKGGRIEGCHHDYLKPLEVRWLCAVCHRVYDNVTKPF